MNANNSSNDPKHANDTGANNTKFLAWLLGSVARIEDEGERKTFAVKLAELVDASPNAALAILQAPLPEDAKASPDPLSETADELEDNALEHIDGIDETQRHAKTRSAPPRPLMKQPVPPPGLRPARAAAILSVIEAGWNGDLGVMAREAYGKNSPHNRRKARSMVHSLKSRKRIGIKEGRYYVK